MVVMVEIILWSEKNHEVHPFASQFAKMIKKDKAGMLKQIKSDLNKKLSSNKYYHINFLPDF